MADVTLKPMTPEFFDPWMADLMAGYAQDHVQAGNWTAEEAQARVEAETRELVPEGVETKDQLFFTAHNDSDETVGALWIAVRRPDQQGAWIYEIEVFQSHRGAGYGRALLAAAETATKEAGATTLGLNVFGPNATARALYESSGYEITTMQMRKTL